MEDIRSKRFRLFYDSKQIFCHQRNLRRIKCSENKQKGKQQQQNTPTRALPLLDLRQSQRKRSRRKKEILEMVHW